MIVKPDTLVRWHREIVRRHWRLRSRRRPGRPRVDAEVKRLVLRLARENPRWGYTKIAGEMRKLGVPRFGRSTVRCILREHGVAPPPQRYRGLIWPEFVGHYGCLVGHFVWACDFLTVTTATLRTYYVFMVLEISTRRIRFWNVSASPDGLWTAQQFRNLAIVSDEAPRCLIHDRDDKFTAHADALLASTATGIVRLPARSPDLNRHIERCIRTLREECLDRIIILSERHLRWVLGEFVRYYNHRRPHRSLELRVPEGPRDYPRQGLIARRQILGGLVNDYYRKAAQAPLTSGVKKPAAPAQACLRPPASSPPLARPSKAFRLAPWDLAVVRTPEETSIPT